MTIKSIIFIVQCLTVFINFSNCRSIGEDDTFNMICFRVQGTTKTSKRNDEVNTNKGCRSNDCKTESNTNNNKKTLFNCPDECYPISFSSMTELTSNLKLKSCLTEKATNKTDCETVNYNNLLPKDKLIFLTATIPHNIFYHVSCLANVSDPQDIMCYQDGDEAYPKLVDSKLTNVLGEFICEAKKKKETRRDDEEAPAEPIPEEPAPVEPPPEEPTTEAPAEVAPPSAVTARPVLYRIKGIMPSKQADKTVIAAKFEYKSNVNAEHKCNTEGETCFFHAKVDKTAKVDTGDKDETAPAPPPDPAPEPPPPVEEPPPEVPEEIEQGGEDE